MILSALTDFYTRMNEKPDSGIPPFGFSYEKISYALLLSTEGELLDVINIMDTTGKKPAPCSLLVPQPPKRAVNIAPCFLWDKSSYVLGLTASELPKDIKRTQQTHEAFKEYHRQWLKGCDGGLQALLQFLEHWNPENPDHAALIPQEAMDSNMVFRLDGEHSYLHQSKSAKAIRSQQLVFDNEEKQTCLVTGKLSPIATLHPAIKEVNGAQSSGASIVSFNKKAFESYGKEQGDNAPVSEEAAFAYTAALNYLLRRDDGNQHRIQIGDATVVFWAEAETAEQVTAGENLFGLLMNPPASSDERQTAILGSALSAIAKGRPLQELNADLEENTQIYVLGLAPNAARLSIRFWESASLTAFAQRLAEHYHDLLLDPLPWKHEPAIWRLLSETVPHREGSKPKFDDVAPQLAGELARAILTGRRYPQSLLTNLLMRMHADGDISSLRVALCKAVLCRNARLNHQTDKEIPMSLDPDNKDPGYLLGRLFASLESAQRAALGKNVNATIRDRYFGAASATPANVFPILIRNAQNHLGKVRKDKAGLAFTLEKQIDGIVELLTPSFPKSLNIESQGRFAIGYYHQRGEIFKKHESEIQEETEQ